MARGRSCRGPCARHPRRRSSTEALGTVEEPLPVVIERDRAQAERVLPLETYLSRRLTPPVVKTGRQMFARHRHAARVRSPSSTACRRRILVGDLGAESNFGRFSGVRPTVQALATLACDPRRSALFRAELFSALEILNRGDIELAADARIVGGRDGTAAVHAVQLPEVRRGLRRRRPARHLESPADVFASIANYLKGYGWIEGRRWGREVSVSKDAAARIAADVAPRGGTCQAKRT